MKTLLSQALIALAVCAVFRVAEIWVRRAVQSFYHRMCRDLQAANGPGPHYDGRRASYLNFRERLKYWSRMRRAKARVRAPKAEACARPGRRAKASDDA